MGDSEGKLKHLIDRDTFSKILECGGSGDRNQDTKNEEFIIK